MSIYSEMLKLVLDGDRDGRNRPVTALVSDALTCRAHLTFGRGARPTDRPGRAAGRVAEMADCLAYDAALVRLCDRLELEHDLTGDGDTRAARMHAEARLAERLPTIAAALGSSEPADIVE